MANQEKPPETVLEIDVAEGSSPASAVEVAARSVNAWTKKLPTVENIAGLSRLTDKLRMLEENSGVKRMADSLRLIQENSTFSRLQDHMRLLDENSAFRRFQDSWLIEENSRFKKLADRMNVSSELARAALGPMWEMRDAGLLGMRHREMETVFKSIESFEARFRLPEMNEVSQLAKLFSASPVSALAAKYFEQDCGMARAMASITTPWLDIQDKLRSMTGFAEMQGIGLALRNMQGFDESLSTMLRLDLGDWRDAITWRPEVLEDYGARSEFYIGLGFNPSLTDFPLPAFEQSLDLAGLRQEPPPLISEYGPPVPLAGEDDDEGLARTNNAHDWLQRMERLLRRFIDEQMTRAFGADWPKHRLPNGIYDQWREKKRKAKEAGAPELPLISYADFTDYHPLICRSDNWREVFEPFFKRPESIRESFQRLFPIRLDTAHSRLITQDDEVLLYVEIKRLVTAIGAWRN